MAIRAPDGAIKTGFVQDLADNCICVFKDINC